MAQLKVNYKEKKILTPDVEKEMSYIIEETNLNIQQDVIATRRSLKKKENELEDIKSSYPFDLQQYLNVKSEIESMKNALKEVATLQAELGFTVTAE